MELLKQITLWLASGTEAAAALIIALAAIESTLRALALLRVSLLTGVATAFVGEVGFVGLVGPHVARLLLGEDHRFFLPGSLLTGAVVMSLASLVSKTVVPGVLLPVGLVTSLIGLPIFFSLILRGRGR